MELLIYVIIAIIWGIVSLIQKLNKDNKTNKNNRRKNYNKENRKFNNNRNNKNEEQIFRELQKNIKTLKNYNEEVLRSNTKDEDVYYNNYETSNNDREILELQEKYNSKISQINNIKNDINYDFNNSYKKENKIHINNILSSLDIKNAIIYNAILEPRRINYMKMKKRS